MMMNCTTSVFATAMRPPPIVYSRTMATLIKRPTILGIPRTPSRATAPTINCVDSCVAVASRCMIVASVRIARL